MLRKEENRQTQKEEFCVENFVPKDHLLRKIEEAVNFSYIYEPIDGDRIPHFATVSYNFRHHFTDGNPRTPFLLN